MWTPDYNALLLQFDGADRRRGQRYAQRGQVRIEQRRTDAAGWRVDAAVRGSMRDPYRITLRLHPDAAEPTLETHCSCPRRRQCKHAAAVLWNLQTEQAKQPTEAVAPAEVERLSLRLHLNDDRVWVQPLLQVDKEHGQQRRLEINPTYLRGAERPQSSLLPMLERLPQLRVDGQHGFELEGTDGTELLIDSLRRGLLLDDDDQPLHPEPAIEANWYWQFHPQGELKPTLRPPDDSPLCWINGPWAWLSTGGLAQVDSGLDPEVAQSLYQLEPLPVEQWERAWGQLVPVLGESFPPPPLPPVSLREKIEPIPVLTLRLVGARDSQLSRRRAQRVGVVRIGFDYGGAQISPTDACTELRTLADGADRPVAESEALQTPGLTVLRWRRHRAAEARRLEQLLSTGVRRVNPRQLGVESLDGDEYLINPDLDGQTLERFCLVSVGRLRESGWQIRYDSGFPLKLMDQEFRLRTEVRTSEGGFELRLHAQLGGQEIELWPALRAALDRPLPPRDGDLVALDLGDGRRVPISAGRLRPLLALVEDSLIDTPSPATGKMPDSAPTTAAMNLALARLPLMREHARQSDAEDVDWVDSASLEQLATILGDAEPVPEVAVPAALQTRLRPYQRLGLSWLSFLGSHGLGGVLADDMGLGKTVQLLAHVLAEREAGRIDGPVLVVAPKSVLPNWRQEIQRFAPSLRVVAIDGPQRKRLFASAAREADLLLTTYPLLSRDLAWWRQLPLDLAVFDESQLVKNPATQAAKAARALPAKRRLALTGTPLENHLGELWAQFDLVLPGLLGPRRRFDKGLRQAIEKQADEAARDLLRQRIAPFLLRRTKDQVIADLPPKTVVTRAIELEGRQHELYQNRAERLAEELSRLANDGNWPRQRMRILEGLLRLRQICCDPRLLGSDESGHSRPSAKLEYLLTMLGELCAEGRRILVFSQFATMLGLIAESLTKLKLPYLLLTGETEDRETPVRRFQAREVPIFLISLRAGGFGLNLTAADTVVHYDPWWNPAVEAQATDRAHRIGQDKPVFVYRLIASQTIEERIVALQERKRELADALFDAQGQSMADLAVEDLLHLIQGESGTWDAPATR